jgi:hypothetical protein
MAESFFNLVYFFIQWPPGVGLCIGLLGFVAVVVSFRLEIGMRPWEKKFWIVLSFVLLMAEAYAIQKKEDNDRTSQIAETVAEDNRFRGILQDNQRDFDATVSRLDTVAGLAKNAVNTVTGGSSFCYIIFPQYSPTDTRVEVFSRGSYPLYDAVVTITDIGVPMPSAV